MTMRTSAILVVALSAGCHEAALRHTPAERYSSAKPYKLVFVHGDPYLEVTFSEVAPIGPFAAARRGARRWLEHEMADGRVWQIRSRPDGTHWMTIDRFPVDPQAVDVTELSR